MFCVKENVFMIVKFQVLELYIENCRKNGLNPTWQGLKHIKNKFMEVQCNVRKN